MIQTMLAGAGDNLFLVVGAAGASTALILFVGLEFYRTRQREQTRREIAAYVAEGSITPSDGERLMRAAAHDPEAASGAHLVVEAGIKDI